MSKLTMEEEALPQMQDFIQKYGIQITLKTLVDSLEKLFKGTKYRENLLIVEMLRGLHTGYCRRYEVDSDLF
jgi:hypothetical protein